MTRIEIRFRVGPDGVLDVKMPVGPEKANREVMITVQPLGTRAQEGREDDRIWSQKASGSALMTCGLRLSPCRAISQDRRYAEEL